MFYDLSGRFKYDQLTPVVSTDTYIQEFGPSLQIGKFKFDHVTPGAVVAADSLQQWEFGSFGVKRIYQLTPVDSPAEEIKDLGSGEAFHAKKDSILREEEQFAIDIATSLVMSGFLERMRK